jgi:eight-cysteine-cluster-containing protein
MKPTSSTVTKAAFLVIFLTISFSFLLKSDRSSQNQKVAEILEIFSDSEGNPVLATGSCNENSDCFPSGCHSLICSSHNITTTCELGQFPEKETYTCGCQNNRCVWYRYR